MATTTDLLTGLAELIDAAGLGVWSPTGDFTAGQTAITHKIMPSQPDRVIVLSPYTVENQIQGDTTQGVQVRTRAPGMPTAVDDLDDAIYQLLHHLEGLNFSAVRIGMVWRQSHGPLGRDDNNRWSNTANYWLQIAKPTPNTR